MYDALTTAAIADELSALLVDGRIQDVAHVDALTIALEVYARQRRWWLTLSADSQRARVVLDPNRVGGDTERVTPLLLLLRKYARGGRIVSVSQPRYERILRVSIAKAMEADNSHADETLVADEPDIAHTELIAETMGRRSNLVYVDEHGRIIEAVKRVTAAMSRARTVLPGQQYVAPPPQDKLEPRQATAERMLLLTRAPAEPLGQWLVSQFVAISPAIAREIAFRADIAADTPANALDHKQCARVVEAMREVFAPLDSGAWQPTVYELPNGRVVATPIEMRSLAALAVTVTAHAAMSAAVLAALSTDSAMEETAPSRHAARRDRLVAEIDNARDRLAHRLASLREQAEQGAASERWREYGEAIYANLADISRGDRELRTPDGLVIELDPLLSASDNAQRYFERYRKAQSATAHVPSIVEATERELAYLMQLLTMTRLAESYDEIETARLEWLAYNAGQSGRSRASRPTGARPSANARRPRAYRTATGDTILVGRTGQQNETVTFEIARPDDLWLHARNMPGAHVIVRAAGEPNPDTIERAAALAAYYSDGRASTNVPVDVAARRHVRKIKGTGPGMVTYRNEHTVNVRPQSETELGLAQAKA